MKCLNCPVAGDYCAGFDARRFCQLLDPSHRDYRPAYLSIVRRLSARGLTGEDAPAVEVDYMPAIAVAPGHCCGGGDLSAPLEPAP